MLGGMRLIAGECEQHKELQRRTATAMQPANQRGSYAAISGSRFAMLGQSPLYHGETGATTDQR